MKKVAPSWIVSTQDEDSNYLYAKGQAPLAEGQDQAVEQAKVSAKQNLAALVKGRMETMPSAKQIAVNDETPFESKLRQAIRAEVKDYQVTVPDADTVYVDKEAGTVFALAKIPKAAIDEAMMERLQALDTQLTDYLHVSSKGSKLNQLLSVLPAMPTIEARAGLKAHLENFKGEPISLPHDQLAELLQKRMNTLVDQIVINLDASTQETAAFETAFRKALVSEGFNMTARKPDLTFKYFIEANESKEETLYKVSLIGDLEMINDLGVTVATVSNEYQGMNEMKPEATGAALMAFADDATDTIVKTSVDYMNKVNQLNYKR
ncbi:hypothetical protein AVO42_02430 [Thiomicrospira sp. XS5]|nr:hypothetical protein AVO42_02430 [Thiomicrospira sp. XS5]